MKDASDLLKVLQRIATTLAAERDLGVAIQVIADGGLELTGAQFAAFFRNTTHEGETFMLYSLAGASPQAFAHFPMPRNTQVFAPTFDGEEVVRSSDITQDPRYGKSAPYHGLPPGHLPVRSYLAVPVKTLTNRIIGSIILGHQEPDVFDQRAEDLAVALAAHAAMAIDNAELNAALKRELAALQSAQIINRRMAGIVESSEDAIISKDLDGTIRTWNPGAERIFGYSAAEAIGQSITMLFPPGHMDEERAIIERIRQGQRVQHYETRRQRKDGSLVEISLSISPVRDVKGDIVGAAKIARDISMRKQQEEELRAANDELERIRYELERRVEERTASLREAVSQVEEFSYTVSHDLRAPLRAMNVHCDVLLTEYRELFEAEPEALRSLQRIWENSARLDQMIRDVLAFGRVARDEVTLGPVDLDLVVRDTISHFPQLQAPSARVESDLLGVVIGHGPSLSQVISNLLTNAVKFVPPNVIPQVRLRKERNGDWVRIWVEDNGIGIDPRHQHRLFTMFERIHPKLPYEGTGVGLAIVRRAMERMGGSVGVVSDGQNGSRFWIELQPGEGVTK